MLKKFLFNSKTARINYIHRCISSTSARTQGTELTQFAEKYDAIKVPGKKPQRPPLVKNFFVAKIDTELMAYPEAFYENDVLNKAKLHKTAYEDFLANNIYTNPNDATNIQKLKESGSSFCAHALLTDRLFSCSEPESKVLSYNHFISTHQIVGQTLADYGNEQLKQKYLPKLSSGELTGALCLMEYKPCSIENRPFYTTAKQNEDDEWIINGEKSYVLLNDLDSSVLLTIATIDSTDMLGDYQQKAALFLIDGRTPGVSISKVSETVGFNEQVFKRATIKFDNVIVDPNNFISEDLQSSVQILNQLRMNVGIMAVSGVMRPIINKLTEYIIDTRIQSIHLKDLDIIKKTIGSLAASCYALEAMIYLTAGLKDIYENQDLDVECAMIKSYAVQTLTEFINSPMHTIGPLVMLKDEGYEKLMRDAFQLISIEEPLYMLKQFIALSGLNHAGKEFNEIIRKKRNLLDHPMFIINRIKKEISIQDPKLKMQIWHYLHPSLMNAGNYLEASVYRLRAVMEILLGRYGPQIFNQGIECAQIADISTLCYAMFAASTRSSRSYCIGLRNGDQEMYMANAFCFDLSQQVIRIAKAVDNGEYGTASHSYKVIGEKLIETKKYHFEHPTERNF